MVKDVKLKIVDITFGTKYSKDQIQQQVIKDSLAQWT
jgi:hypothetical protein